MRKLSVLPLLTLASVLGAQTTNRINLATQTQGTLPAANLPIVPVMGSEMAVSGATWASTPSSGFWTTTGNTVTVSGTATTYISNYTTSNIVPVLGQRYSLAVTASAGACGYYTFGDAGQAGYFPLAVGTSTLLYTAASTNPLKVYSCSGAQSWSATFSIKTATGGDLVFAGGTFHGKLTVDYGSTTGALQIGNYTADYCGGETAYVKGCVFGLSANGGLHFLADLSTYMGNSSAGQGDIDVRPHVIGPWDHWTDIQLRAQRDPGTGAVIAHGEALYIGEALISGVQDQYIAISINEPTLSGGASIGTPENPTFEHLLDLGPQPGCQAVTGNQCFAIFSTSTATSYFNGGLNLQVPGSGAALTIGNTTSLTGPCGASPCPLNSWSLNAYQTGQLIWNGPSGTFLTVSSDGNTVTFPKAVSLTGGLTAPTFSGYTVVNSADAASSAVLEIDELGGTHQSVISMKNGGQGSPTISIFSQTSAGAAIFGMTDQKTSQNFLYLTGTVLHLGEGNNAVSIDATGNTAVNNNLTAAQFILASHGSDSKLPVCESAGIFYPGTNTSGALSCP